MSLPRGRLLRRAAALVAASAGATLSLPRRAAAQTLPTLRVASIPSDVGAEPWYAAARGFFKRAGLDAQVSGLNNGGAIVAAILSGAADIGLSNTVSVVEAHDKNLPISVVAGATLHVTDKPNTGLLIVRRDSGIATAKDLNGKTVAVSPVKGISQLAVSAWADAHGGDASTIRFVEMPFPAQAPAVREGKIDAASVNIYADTAQTSEHIIASVFDAISPRFLDAVFVASKAAIAQQPDLMRRFAQAMRETEAWANKNPQASADVLADVTKQSAAALNGVTRATYQTAVTEALLQPVIDAAAKYQFIAKRFPARELIAATTT